MEPSFHAGALISVFSVTEWWQLSESVRSFGDNFISMNGQLSALWEYNALPVKRRASLWTEQRTVSVCVWACVNRKSPQRQPCKPCGMCVLRKAELYPNKQCPTVLSGPRHDDVTECVSNALTGWMFQCVCWVALRLDLETGLTTTKTLHCSNGSSGSC